MASYVAPLREIQFVLHDVLNAGRLAELPGYEDAGRDTLDGLLDEAAKLVQEQLAPLNAKGDDGVRLQDGAVTTPEGFRDFWKLYSESGWIGVSLPTEFGGQGLPYIVSKVVEELVCASNVAFALYPGLTVGCFEALHACADEAQKKQWLPRLANGEWGGTMCITEPQAGSDVGAIKTRAVPQDDGSYRIEGNKIFISSGEHDLTDNIVHFVLARLPDSPAGVKGLTTFVVPKFLPKADGTPGERNAARCVSIEHKMGLHGSATCAMAFEGATGWMVGKPNQGIQNMFVMMNLERIMVGFQGLGLMELATQNAVRYARERKQGRTAGGEEAIVHHPDVRRMLLTMKALTEGGRAMAYDTALKLDLQRAAPDAAEREAATDWIDLMTPIVKSMLTDGAVELGSTAIQVYGGHGYIQEHGIEQILRDAKILCLYEGTNGIQAMDLVRRKLLLHNGRLPKRFLETARAGLPGDDRLAFLAQPLGAALDALEETIGWLQGRWNERPDDAGFGAVEFQRAFSLCVLGHYWMRIATAALDHADAGLKAGKLATARHFASRLLSQVPSICATVRTSSEAEMALDADLL